MWCGTSELVFYHSHWEHCREHCPCSSLNELIPSVVKDIAWRFSQLGEYDLLKLLNILPYQLAFWSHLFLLVTVFQATVFTLSHLSKTCSCIHPCSPNSPCTDSLPACYLFFSVCSKLSMEAFHSHWI